MVDISSNENGTAAFVAAVGGSIVYGYAPPYDEGFYGLSTYVIYEQVDDITAVGISFRDNGLPIIAASIDGGIAIAACEDIVCWRHRMAFVEGDSTSERVNIEASPDSDEVTVVYTNGTERDLVLAVYEYPRSAYSRVLFDGPVSSVGHKFDSNGNLYGAYRDAFSLVDQQRVFACNDATCAVSASTIYYSELQAPGSGPRFDFSVDEALGMAYTISTTGELLLTTCTSLGQCDSPVTVTDISGSFDFQYDTDGKPVFAVATEDSVIRLLKCKNSDCLLFV